MTGAVADFDTLAALRALESAGFAKRQAGAIRGARAGLASLEADMLKAAVGIVIAQTASTADPAFGVTEIFGGAP